jgi:predicted nucleic acid-binding protein
VVRIIVDSYAWIEIFLGSGKGQSAIQAIQEAELVFTPETVLAEIARKYLREGTSEQIVRSRLQIISENSEISHTDATMAVASGKAYIEIDERAKREKITKPSLFDAIVLANARVNEAKVLTGDRHFRGLPETLWLE